LKPANQMIVGFFFN